MKQSKKLQYFLLIAILGAGMCTREGAAQSSVAESKVTIELMKKIEPLRENNSGSRKPIANIPPEQLKKMSGTLVNTGIIFNDWPMIGMFLIWLMLVFRYVAKRKKRKKRYKIIK